MIINIDDRFHVKGAGKVKKIKAIIITAAGVTTAGIIGVTMAANTPQGRTTGKISTPGIGVEIRHSGIEEKAGVQAIKDGNNIIGVSYTGVPGAGNKVSDVVTVWNTKERPIYLRVTINKTWSNADGTRNFDLDPQQIKVMYKDGALADGNAGDGWIIQDRDTDGQLFDDGETVYCYYQYPVSQGRQTSELIDSFAVMSEHPEDIGNEYTGMSASVTFEADAMQQTAVESAMEAEWGVIPEMDGTTISSNSEQ